MDQSEYESQDAVGLAELIAKKKVSAAEVLEAAIIRAEAVDPKLNALTLKLYDRARDEVTAGPPPGPLGGVPFLLKDLGAMLEGAPTSGGSRLLGKTPAAADSAIVALYRQGGLVIFGKTNTPEFGLEPVTEPERFGAARNPWDLSRTPGGSSGGAAAATAAGIVPAAHATDGGGSIRIPASCCGLFGLKPSRGRVSQAPGDEGWGGFSCPHAVTRSVRDSAALLDLVAAPQPGDPYWLDPPARAFREEVGRDPGRLRIAFWTEGLAGETIDPECSEAVRETARLLESLGHHLEEKRPPGDYRALREAAGVVVAANTAAALAIEGDRRDRPVAKEEVEDLTWTLAETGRATAATDYIRSLQAAHAFGREMAAFFNSCDVLLTSTLGKPPIEVGALRGSPPDMAGYGDRLFSFMPNTQPFNMTGQPAMSVPLAWSKEGLPIGLQFAAPQAGESLLFRLAGQLETARPWATRRPAAL
ncbi:MAG: amidase [Caulobacteraceae bacterium]